MDDSRSDFTIIELYAAGQRVTVKYDREDAVSEFLEMHPDADEAEVRAELERELAKIVSVTP